MRKDKGLLPALILAIICLVATALLAFTNQATLQARQQQAIDSENEKKFALFPDADRFEILDPGSDLEKFPEITNVNEVFDAAGNQLGYLFTAANRGYAGVVPIMAAITPDGLISGIRVLANEETPGLGKKVEDQSFLKQFIGEKTSVLYTTKPDETGRTSIDSVSGATISSRAVSESINEINQLYEIMKKEGE